MGKDKHRGGQIMKPTQAPQVLSTEGANVSSTISVMREFHGPLPHPSVLGGYDQVQAGFAERVMAMAEREAANRHAAENAAATASVAADARGQWMAVTVVMAGFGTAVALAGFDAPAAAAIVGGLQIVGVATAFLGKRLVKRGSES